MTKDPVPKTPQKTPKKRQAVVSEAYDESPSKKRQTVGAEVDDYSPAERLARVAAGMDLHSQTNSPMAPPIPFRSSRDREMSESTTTLTGNNTDLPPDAVEPGLSVIGEHVTKLVDLITALRDNGVDRLALDLPQIVVVGDQSTGKSSLIEGLSGIKVPRDEGICTRCPIEINVKPMADGAWHCRISIVRKYGYKTSKTNSGPSLGLGNYNVEFATAIVEPFAEVTDRNEIPEWLRRAQVAVLNPSQSYQKFAVPLTERIDYLATEESFSPNVIRMDISGPNLPSLSFFDLPGVIVQDSERHVPKLIRKLVKGYIKNSKSLVLLTLPIDCDRANSQAAGLVDEAKAEGRTIGIISKPDRLVTANIPQWKEILSGKKFSYQLGYRVVKNPADPRVDWAEARHQEREFFEKDYNFRIHLKSFRQQFGTERLQVFLSKHLLTMIKDCLPEIQEKVGNRASIITRELSTLPKPRTGNVVFEIHQRIRDFESLLTAIVTNSVDYKKNDILARTTAATWFQEWHKLAQIFYEQLIQSAPRLDVKGSRSSSAASMQNGKANEMVIIDDDSDDSDEPTTIRPTQRRQDAILQHSTAPTMQPTLNEREVKSIRDFVNKSTKKFTLSQLQSCVHRYNNGVSGISDPRVFKHLVQESTKCWGPCAEQFLFQTGQTCGKVVEDLLLVIFTDLNDTKLLEHIRLSTQDLVSSLHSEQCDLSGLLLNLENQSPLTLNHEEQETAKHAILAELVKQVQDLKIKRRLDKLMETQGRYNSADEKRVTEVIRSDPNQNHQELIELAGAIAYYRIAARRLADYLALSIRNGYFYNLTTKMHTKLCGDLGISLEGDSDLNRTNEELIKLMAPPHALYKRRCQLEQELDILTRTEKNVLDILQGNDQKHTPVALKQETQIQGGRDLEMDG